ncbi:forkhead box protein J1 [Echinops telfairi]|uniref:Forkhead box protein J1 n=1 Tax=Echinops telfairi TaxID=9371 RepID=A0AC55DUL2_ECHTE|nr:forkhead box protein J1 [Echinops telfairi]
MAENWLRLPGAGPAEEALPEGGLEEPDALDDSLTSLQWLQEFSILSAKAPTLPPGGADPHGYHQVPGSAAPGSPLAADPACLGPPHTPGKPTSSCTSRSAPPGLQAPPPDDVDYATNPHVKPPYSYATLICMAMQASKATKITLSAIYKWITDNFCYFRHADPTWQMVWARGSPKKEHSEAQQLLQEFEEATGEVGWAGGDSRPGHKRKQPLPKRVAKVPRAPSTPLLSQEEQGELEPLKGNFDWEAIFDAGPLGGELGSLDGLELSPPLSPASHGDVDLTVHGHHIDCPTTWGPLVEQAADSLDFDETFLAASFLQHPWDEGGSGCLPPEPLFEAGEASLATELQDWTSVGAFL